MNKNLKDILAQRLAENTLRHAEAQQEADLDLGREFCKIALDRIEPNPYQPRRVLQRLALNPRLLSRSAAADLRRALNSTDDVVLRQAACEEAWSLLEAGELEQTKLAAYVRRLLTETSSPSVLAPALSTLCSRSGEPIATWNRGRKALTVKIPAAVLTPERETQLQAYLQSLFDAPDPTIPPSD